MCALLKRGEAAPFASRCCVNRATGLIPVGAVLVAFELVACGQHQATPASSSDTASSPPADESSSDTTTGAFDSKPSSDAAPSSEGAVTNTSSTHVATAPTSAPHSDVTTDPPVDTPTGGSTLSTPTSASTTISVAASNTQNTTEAGSTALPLPTFTRHDVATFANGYYTSAFDIDGDGLRDIAALAAGGSEIVWYQNPMWEPFSITTDVTGVICMAPHDVDGDGDLDLAFASDFSMTATSTGGTIQWAEAPDDPITTDSWVLHPIGAIPTAHRVRWANLDGTSDDTLVALPIFGRGSASPQYVGAVEFTAFARDSANGDTWLPTLLDDSLLEVAHGMSIIDWDGDGVDDILTASNAGVHLFQPPAGTAPTQLGVGAAGERPDKGSSEVGLGALGTDRFIATVEPWHGTDLVIYTPNASPTEPWTRTVFGTEFVKGHALMTADLNADGYDEVIAGDQGDQGALLVYRYDTTAREWQRVDLDVGGIAVVGIDVQDVNSDGTLDIVAIGGSTNNVVWYENPANSGN